MRISSDGHIIGAVKVTCLVAFLCGATWAPVAEAADAGWPGWRGPTHDGQYSEIPQTMPEVKLLWKSRMAGRCDAGLAAAEGVVVAADGDGRRNDYYWCFDAATGKELWMAKTSNGRQLDYGSAPRATPAIYKGKAITIGAFGDVQCFDLKTGRVVWKKHYIKDYRAGKVPTWGFAAAPLIFDDKLIITPNALMALNPNTGKTIWTAKTAGANYSAFAAGKVGGVRQIIGYDAATVGGWDIASGKQLWGMPADNSKGYIVPSPVLTGGKLVLATESEDTRMYKFGAGGVLNVEPLAENADFNPEMATPTVQGDVLLGVCNGLICMDPNDSLKTLWIQNKEDSFLGMAHIIATKDRALVFGDKGEMVMIRATRKKCEILGRIKLSGTKGKASVVWAPPAIADGRIFVRDEKYLYAYEMIQPKTAR